MITASLAADLRNIAGSIADAFLNVAFTGSVLLSVALTLGVVWYARRRPVGAPLSWGQAMLAAVYVTFLLYWFFGVVPDRWMIHAEGEMAMRADAILAGPGSTGWLEGFPVVVTKQAVADFVTINIYGIGFVASVAMWAVWQGRGKKTVDEVETSSYGRPLVKA